VIIQRDLTPEKLAGVIKKYRAPGAGAMSAAPMQNTAAE